jgi:heme/copper-type cytochrome/quinol oxidase subunit 3
MTEMAALAYGLVASFTMASLARNRREERRNPPTLTLMSWLLLSFSAAFGALLLGYAGIRALGAA